MGGFFYPFPGAIYEDSRVSEVFAQKNLEPLLCWGFKTEGLHSMFVLVLSLQYFALKKRCNKRDLVRTDVSDRLKMDLKLLAKIVIFCV